MKLQKYFAISIWLFIAACGDRPMPTSPDARLDSSAALTPQTSNTPNVSSGSGSTDTTSVNPAWSSSSSSGGTVKEILSGPAIDGVTPRGLATADLSQFLSGGSTVLTVEVKDVNLADGTVLVVTL